MSLAQVAAFAERVIGHKDNGETEQVCFPCATQIDLEVDINPSLLGYHQPRP